MARKLGSVGDINPIEHGGGYVLHTKEQGYWVEYSEGISDLEDAWDIDLTDPETLRTVQVTVYRFDLERDGNALMASIDWADLDKVKASIGADDWGNLRTAQQRANLVMDIAGHYGWHELDSYPLTMSVGALIERWKGY